jgi:hypothetical protein
VVQQKPGLAGRTAITNQANIFFDINDPIVTNVYTNTIDTGLPTSTMATFTGVVDLSYGFYSVATDRV